MMPPPKDSEIKSASTDASVGTDGNHDGPRSAKSTTTFGKSNEMNSSNALIRVVLVLAAICLSVAACSNSDRRVEAPSVSAETTPAVPEAPPPKKLPCPVKLTHSRMVHNLEEDVYTTVVNISDSDITAIAFGSAHTDLFGKTWTPYKTDLTSEDTIKRGRSQSMHWEVLMEEPSTIQGKKPGSSELYVTKVAFSDGRVVDILGIEGCDFAF